MHQAPSIVYQIPFAFIALVSLAGSGHLLGRANSRHLYVLTYMASLFVCLAGLVAIFAHYTAAFDSAGMPQSITGYTGLWLLKNLTDFETEVFVLTASASVIVIPPVLSYLITGLYGFAVWQLFFRPVLRWLVFSFVKFLVGYSIITIILFPWAYFEGWVERSPNILSFTCLMAVILYSYALWIDWLVIESTKLPGLILSILPTKSVSILQEIHKFMIRKHCKQASSASA